MPWTDKFVANYKEYRNYLFPLLCQFLYLLLIDMLSFKLFLHINSAGVIEVLVNSGRQIDAVNLAFAFDLMEQFSPVPLLKSYLKEARKVALPGKPGSASPTNVQVRVLSQLHQLNHPSLSTIIS